MSEIIHLPPVMERYEIKYLIPWSYVEPITQFIRPYCSMDYHSMQAKTENYFYLVNNLYFDTPGYEFLKQRISGKQIRFNMRVRTYGDGEKPPYFLEVKHRTGIQAVVKKFRGTAHQGEWPHLLTDPAYRVPESDDEKDKTNKKLFLHLAISYAIKPIILTQYKRRAFFSTIDEYARITMDADMKYRTQDNYDLSTDHGMNNYDNETIYSPGTQDLGSVVLELKAPVGQVPLWMLDLIRHFELKQQGFSKYVSSTLVSMYDNGNWYMPSDRMFNL
ncbi:MAG: polyphosphate polymerase domain-containing protein [Nitrospiria bacterium]